MASFRSSPSISAAVRQQPSCVSPYLRSTQFITSSKPFSTSSVVCSQQRCTQSRKLPFPQLLSPSYLLTGVEGKKIYTNDTVENPLQFPARPSSSKLAVPARQTRTFLARLARRSPSTQAQQQPQQQTQQTQQTEQQKQNPPLRLTNLPYFVRRTPSNNLPVYLVTKAGGTKRQTKIQKTEGDLEALRTDLARALGLEPADGSGKKSPDVTINQLNGHIIVKVRPSFFFAPSVSGLCAQFAFHIIPRATEGGER